MKLQILVDAGNFNYSLYFMVGIMGAGKHIQVLGLFPNRDRTLQFLYGFCPMAILALIYFLLLSKALNAEVNINVTYSFSDFLYGSWWTLRSVLFEELIFRGVLLFLALKYLGKYKGMILSAIVFGIFHWFSYNILGDLTAMIYIFMITGVAGFVFAYAFCVTGSLYLPIGLHFGWNLIAITIFSQGPLGDQLLISSTVNTLGGWWKLFSFLYQIVLLPAFTFCYLHYFHKKDFVVKRETESIVYYKGD